MATIWAITDDGRGEWARSALRRAGHVVLVMCAEVARMRLGTERPDLAILDLSAEDVYALCDELEPVRMLCLGKPGSMADRAMGTMLTNGASCIPNARGHELELVGAVRLQLERAGVGDG